MKSEIFHADYVEAWELFKCKNWLIGRMWSLERRS